MAQLHGKLALHDPVNCRGRADTDGGSCILDVEAFIRATIAKVRLVASTDDLDDLVAEGFTIVSRMHQIYEPGRDGQDPSTSRFSGFVAQYLPGKLSDAWHRLQENHRLVTGPDGERRWHYGDKPASLQAVTDTEPADRVKELHTSDQYFETGIANGLRVALDQRWQHDREITVRFGVLLGNGYAAPDATRALRISPREADACIERIKGIAHTLETGAA